VANKEVLDKIKVKSLKTVISTVPNTRDNLFLVRYIKNKNKKINMIVTANHVHQAKRLYRAGADYVILPHIISGEKVASMLKKSTNNKKYFENIKGRNIKRLD
jgi:voltage-gated potassium channel